MEYFDKQSNSATMKGQIAILHPFFVLLPESLALLPKLNSLKIDGNPFERLPLAFNQVKGLQMSIKDKRRLLDFEYRGADGKGLLKWDDSQFFADGKSPLLKPVLDVIKKNRLTDYQADLLALAKKTVGFKQTGLENYEKIGNTRFGGMPDLPKSIKYPKFKYDYDKTTYKYEFIAQINCEEIASLQDYMPRKGMLYFFLSSLHFFGVEDNFKLVQVLFYDGEEELISGKKLKFKNEDYYEMVGDAHYEALQVAAVEEISLPYFYSYHTNTHIFKGRAEKLFETFEKNEKFEQGFYDKFENPTYELRKADFEINGYIFTQHESPELQAALSQKGEPQDWINLLRVSSRGDFQWGDAGDLAFVIHKSDLLKKNFSNVFCTVESS
ncbi:MAG: YwqG family protein [Emticicia sp.]|nr:YwqG family protein [Emticicia sp.]